MSKIIALVLALCCCLCAISGAQAESFTAEANGFGGTVSVTLTLEGDTLQDVVIKGDMETVGIGSRAIEQMPGAMLERNSVAVDALSGATLTSTAILKAAAEALEASGVTLAEREVQEKAVTYEDTAADIVVVGGGIAGISAAITAADAGKSVILLEKTGGIGGAAMTAAGAVWAIGAEPTAEKYDFTADELYAYINEKSGPVNNKELFYALAQRSTDSYHFMMDNGVAFPSVFQCNPTAAPKFWGMFAQDGGAGMMEALRKAVEGREGVDIRIGHSATKLHTDDAGNVTGVQVETEGGAYRIDAGKVILATGGIGQNPEMMAQYVPNYDRLVMNATYLGATGDGHRMVLDLGGEIVGYGSMGSVGGTNDRGGKANPVTDGQPLVLNIHGEQVAPSNAHYTHVYSLCLEEESGTLYVLFPGNIEAYTQLTVERMEQMVTSGGGWKADTLEELAEMVGMDKENLLAAVKAHNQFAAEQKDDDFGTPASSMIPIEEGPFYMMNRVPTLIGTIPAVKVDAQCRVLRGDGKPVGNLYAAGEMIYGNWFNQGYPMSGTGLGGCVSSARIAVQDILDHE